MNAGRRLRLMAALTAAILAGGVALVWLLNPYGATSSRLVDPIFRRIKYDRADTPYLLRAARPETVLVGSSRVQLGMRIEQGERDGVLNAGIRGATLAQIAAIIEVALINPRLRRIVWGVDFFAFNATWDAPDPDFNARIADRPRARIEDTLLSLTALDDGFNMLKLALMGRARLRPAMAAPAPWPRALICREYIIDRNDGLALAPPARVATQLGQIIHLYDPYTFAPRMLARFRRIVATIRARKVELILFVPPMSEYELELIRQAGDWGRFERFKRALAASSPFIDFAAYNAMARRDDFYTQVIHFKPDAGFQILRLMLGMAAPACGADARAVNVSAIAVNAGNIDDVLARERRMRDQAVSSPNRYAWAAGVALRGRRAACRLRLMNGGDL